jgi:hypothetical protein
MIQKTHRTSSRQTLKKRLLGAKGGINVFRAGGVPVFLASGSY